MDNQNLTYEFSRFIDIMLRLRKECPWDNKQTPETLRQYILEETHEVLESIDAQNWTDLKEELGDLFLQIVFQAVIAAEQNRFDLREVISGISEKMIRRHPHVFGKTDATTAREVENNWEHIKINEKNRDSVLSGVPAAAPALLRAQRLQEKASRVGFDWENVKDVVAKVEEELSEVKQALASKNREKIFEECGDLLFSVVNFARFTGVVAEDALRASSNKFVKRFKKIEESFDHDYSRIKEAPLQEMDRIWNDSKKKGK